MLVNIWLTGGLHLDGGMDTADGLAVSNPERRLEVGAFGAMALVVIIISKWLSLAVVDGWVLPSVMACGQFRLFPISKLLAKVNSIRKASLCCKCRISALA
ncbi:MAG: adenosylcobinamide-GDP ribazoletransferase [Pseudanabaenaceae cyanobacterium]